MTKPEMTKGEMAGKIREIRNAIFGGNEPTTRPELAFILGGKIDTVDFVNLMAYMNKQRQVEEQSGWVLAEILTALDK